MDKLSVFDFTSRTSIACASKGSDVAILVVAPHPSINGLFRWIEASTTLTKNGGVLRSIVAMQTVVDGLRPSFLRISEGAAFRWVNGHWVKHSIWLPNGSLSIDHGANDELTKK